jgi:hypothetical protein
MLAGAAWGRSGRTRGGTSLILRQGNNILNSVKSACLEAEWEGDSSDMAAWTIPRFDKAAVNAAGKDLVGGNVLKYSACLEIVNNWRTAHNFPLNTFQIGLRRRASKINKDALIAQRTKRLSSIEAKLKRFSSMRLFDMQDLGGCRAVMANVLEVVKLLESLKGSEMRHVLLRETDYITHPQKSGYRGIHLIYRYNSDRSNTYNGLKTEIQIRSSRQHAWATAVETVGTFTRQALKSSQGEADWLRFFALMGSAIARMERRNLVEGTPTDEQGLKDELIHYVKELDVSNHLHAYGQAMKTIQTTQKGDHYFLLVLDPKAKQIEIIGYKQRELETANKKYLEIEESIKNSPKDAVLVSVDSVNTLSRAYPNYFLDTMVFMRLVNQSIGKAPL